MMYKLYTVNYKSATREHNLGHISRPRYKLMQRRVIEVKHNVDTALTVSLYGC